MNPLDRRVYVKATVRDRPEDGRTYGVQLAEVLAASDDEQHWALAERVARTLHECAEAINPLTCGTPDDYMPEARVVVHALAALDEKRTR
jgi:hypothetical protein